MPVITKAQLVEENRELRARNDLLAIALTFEASGVKPDAEERWHDSTEKLVWRLYGATRMGGGIVVMLRTDENTGKPGFGPTKAPRLASVNAFQLDACRDQARQQAAHVPNPFTVAWRDAMDRLVGKRNELLNAALEG